MNSFRKGLVALFAFVAVATAPVAAVASSFHFTDKIQIVSVAQADEAPAPAVSPSPSAPAEQSGVGKAGDFLGDLAGKIPLEGIVVTVLIFIYDFVRRRMKTDKPASVVRDVQSLIRGIVALLQKLDALGDKILGQNLK
jgi:hypothetical protein